MKTKQYKWLNKNWIDVNESVDVNPQICLLFGTRETIENEPEYYDQLKLKYPTADIVVSSTAGNIVGEELMDDTIIATCIELENSRVVPRLFHFEDKNDMKLGEHIAQDCLADDLSYLLILSTSGINAGNMLKGINSVLKGKHAVSGGVAGDNFAFKKTLVGLNNSVGEARVVAVSFYGDSIKTVHGSKGGWDVFGPKRTVTKCEGNVLAELDGQPILDLYKEYLGEKAKDLPASALHFPLAIIDPETNEYIVRGVQDTDEKTNSLILFGDVHEGDSIQLMKANFDRVIDGAIDSAHQAFNNDMGDPDLSILISCVGRRVVLDQLTEEELSEARKVLGQDTTMCGFYSYSELSPIVGDNSCHLHNQTMTITNIYESK